MRATQSFTTMILFAGLAAASGAVAQAQTSIAASLYGAFDGSTSGNNTQQSPANAAGGLVALRQIRNPLVGYEATYTYNRDNQTYSTSSYAVCGLCTAGGSRQPSVSANARINRRLGGVSGRTQALSGRSHWPAVAFSSMCPATDRPPPQLSLPSVAGETLGSRRAPSRPTRSLRARQPKGSLFTEPVSTGRYCRISACACSIVATSTKPPTSPALSASTNAFTHTAEPVIGIYFRL